LNFVEYNFIELKFLIDYYVNHEIAFELQTFPFFGVLPVLLDESGKEIEGPGEGYLVFRRPWPGMMRTLFGNHERFEETYFKKFPGYYCTGDGKFE
jgi:acyl-coenzyme A synthetase/AMP-(fatty) acid ligase